MILYHFDYETESGCCEGWFDSSVMFVKSVVRLYQQTKQVGFTIYEGKVVQRLIQLAVEQ
jgi:hypothetical protein